MRVHSYLLCLLFTYTQCSLRNDQDYWKKLAKNELEEALKVKWNQDTAKNVILFIGDGMGPNTVTATRIHEGGESFRLSYEKFPHVGLLKTYSANKMVPDSACTASALMTGVKVNLGTIAVDATVPAKDCMASVDKKTHLKSLAAIALEAGKSAGVVTTMRVTHATPAPMYAHSAWRSWECYTPRDECKDIARQLVEDWPGKDLNVIMGGGLDTLVDRPDVTFVDPWGCKRKDGLDLLAKWKEDKIARGLKHNIVQNNQQLNIELNVDDTDYLLGIFNASHLPYEHERSIGPQGSPSLSTMVKAAIKVLARNPRGFFLMVEGGNIDMAHHRGTAKRAIYEAAALNEAVKAALAIVNVSETLVVVTSDHGHTMTINGFADRGSSVFGFAGKSVVDNVNYTTLTYGTGGPASMQYEVVKDENQEPKVRRRDPSLEDSEDVDYVQPAAIMLDENSHGGGDVVVYAIGPNAHLFHNVHEQHYVFHAISYAAKMGEYFSSSSRIYSFSIFNCVLLSALCLIL